MAHIHLIEGPVGAGKSTFGAQLSRQLKAPQLVVDDWMATLFAPDRPDSDTIAWYLERKDRCIEQIWTITCGLMEVGIDAVLELGLIQSASRQLFYERMDAAEYPFTVHVIEASREVRRARVRARNKTRGATYSMDVPDGFFELASDMWQRPGDEECVGRDIQFVSSKSEAPPAEIR